MANLTWWRRPAISTLRRDMEDILEDFDISRSFRREIDRLFSEELAPRTSWSEMEQLFDDFVSPQPLRRRMASLFEPLVGATRSLLGRGGETMFMPNIELTERDDSYVLRADLPGVREQDVNVNLDDDNVLTISGERRREEAKRERGYEYTEREYGSFTRSVQLPRGADASKIEADFRNGVLEVHVPKGEGARARHIPIGGREGRELGGRKEEQPRVLDTGDGGRKDKSQSRSQS